ncbi:senescence-associated gene 21 [Striga hermonthica]|uniref:Senescence-associated gene 21 n=1 Tax=Striga hermonthica TaxID=68872 RepID=A0A9N7NGQ9_STRHE|nr:senescence-associated gene 21 [Striga hermonthica]
MARSLSNAKNFTVQIAGKMSAIVSRRGYAAAVSQVGESSGSRSGAPNLILKKGSEEPAKISWVPDPVTGFYRPENQAKEIDAVELRAMLLKSKFGRN